MAKELIAIVLAMLPVAELRLSIPIGITVFNMPWYEAFGLGILGNLIPVPFLLLFFDGVSRLVQKVPIGKRFIDWLLTRTARHTGTIQKYKFTGLALFVAIPLPITGHGRHPCWPIYWDLNSGRLFCLSAWGCSERL
jgi:uncharacterized membrane protein